MALEKHTDPDSVADTAEGIADHTAAGTAGHTAAGTVGHTAEKVARIPDFHRAQGHSPETDTVALGFGVGKGDDSSLGFRYGAHHMVQLQEVGTATNFAAIVDSDWVA
jgi:hypothetical protein